MLNFQPCASLTRGGRYDQNLISGYDILYHDNNTYHDIVIFFLKVFIILKSLIPYNFHNHCHRCQYQTSRAVRAVKTPISTIRAIMNNFQSTENVMNLPGRGRVSMSS